MLLILLVIVGCINRNFHINHYDSFTVLPLQLDGIAGDRIGNFTDDI